MVFNGWYPVLTLVLRVFGMHDEGSPEGCRRRMRLSVGVHGPRVPLYQDYYARVTVVSP